MLYPIMWSSFKLACLVMCVCRFSTQPWAHDERMVMVIGLINERPVAAGEAVAWKAMITERLVNNTLKGMIGRPRPDQLPLLGVGRMEHFPELVEKLAEKMSGVGRPMGPVDVRIHVVDSICMLFLLLILLS